MTETNTTTTAPTSHTFAYTNEGHLLSPSGYRLGHITGLDWFTITTGIFAATFLCLTQAHNGVAHPGVLYALVTALILPYMFIDLVSRTHTIAKDVREAGYTNTGAYRHAAREHRDLVARVSDNIERNNLTTR